MVLNLASRVHGHRPAVMETFLKAPRMGRHKCDVQVRYQECSLDVTGRSSRLHLQRSSSTALGCDMEGHAGSGLAPRIRNDQGLGTLELDCDARLGIDTTTNTRRLPSPR
jgi:hypothetical protein